MDPRPSEDRPISRSDRLVAVSLAAGVLTLYLATRLQVHNQCGDCTNYAATIRTGELGGLFSGGHLIYLWLVRWIYQFVKLGLPGADAFAVAQVFNSIMASLAIVAFYLLARSILRERWLSLGLSLILAFSYDYWLFAVDVEVHAPAVLFCFLTLLSATRLQANAAIGQIVALGILTATAILFHVFSSLMGAVIVLLLLQRGGPVQSPARWSTRPLGGIFLYISTTSLLVTVAYLTVTTQGLQLRTVGDIVSWIFSFRGDVGYWSRAALPVGQTLVLSGTAIVRSLVSTVTWIATPGLGQLLAREFAGKCTGEELYLTRNLGSVVAAFLTASSILAEVFLGVLVIRSLRGVVAELRRMSRAGVSLLAWLVLYACLIMYSGPGSAEHWAIYWMPIFLLAVGLGLAEMGHGERRRGNFTGGLMVAVVISLFVANIGSVLLQTNPDNDVYLSRLKWYEANTEATDLIVVAGGHSWRGYLRYYLEAESEVLEELFWLGDYEQAWETVKRDMRRIEAEGGRVFVTQDALRPEPCMAGYRNWDLAQFSSFKQDISPYVSCFESEGVAICEVTRPEPGGG